MSDQMEINVDSIKNTSKELFGKIVRTPTIKSQYLSSETNAEIFLKLENLQYTSSFKVRGAYVSIKRLDDRQKKSGVIAMSAGNHAQAVAWWAKKASVKATIVMPEHAPLSKVMKTKSLGAKVMLKGRTLNESQSYVTELIDSQKLTLIHPYDDPNVIIGQGTLGLEFIEDVVKLEVLIVPIGGGGLISGIAIVAKALNPKIKIYGVQTEKFPSMYNVLHKKDLEILGDTLADGIAVKRPGKITSEIIKGHVDDILLINEFELERSISSLFENERIVAEGAGAAGVAALMKNKDKFSGKKVGTVICGGNIDARLFASILNRKLLMDGRMTKVRIDIIDEPGMLARISNLIAKYGGNIIEIYHQRMFNDVPVKNAKIDAIIEALSVEHIASIIKALRDDGFQVSEIMERS
jgi:threonine dehydratase